MVVSKQVLNNRVVYDNRKEAPALKIILPPTSEHVEQNLKNRANVKLLLDST
jgi:hypothetical protein